MADDELEPPALVPEDAFEPDGTDDPDARLRYIRDQRRAVLRRRDEAPEPDPPPPDDDE